MDTAGMKQRQHVSFARSITAVARLRARIAGAICVLTLMTASAGATAACDLSDGSALAALTIGMPPWSSSQLSNMWTSKLGRYLLYEHCIDANIRSDADYASYIQSAAAGRYDALSAPPHLGLYLIQHHGMQPIAFESYAGGQTVFFVLASSQITEWTDVVGMTVATPDPLALVSLVANNELAGFIPPVRLEQYGKHDRVIRAVLTRHADVGVVFSLMLDSFRAENPGEFRILRAVPFDANGLLLVRPDFPEEARSKLLTALLQFKSDIAPLLQWHEIDSKEMTQLQTSMAPYVDAIRLQLDRNGHPTAAVPKP